MVDFDEFVVMKEKFLEELNIAIDSIIEEKQFMPMHYNFIEKALEAMIKSSNVNIRTEEVVITPVDKGQVLKIALDFFKSVDSEFYKEAVEIILQQNKNIKMNIYNIHSIEDFEVEDENGLCEYLPYGCAQSLNGYALVNIPIREELNNEGEKSIHKDCCTLGDLYTFVHEISHCFDLNLDRERLTGKELTEKDIIYEDNLTREFTAEGTTIAFEMMLSEYLVKNNLYSSTVIEQIKNNRMISCLQHAKIVHTKLLLAREKQKKEEVSLEFIEKYMKDNNLSIQDVRNMAMYIIDSPQDMYIQNRYAMGGLIAPTIVKTYKRKGPDALKKYFDEIKSCNLKSALDKIGVKLNVQGINELVNNYSKYIHTLKGNTPINTEIISAWER